jgi:hypothetical protein
MRMGRQQFGTFYQLLLLVIPEPLLARFKARSDRMTGRRGMFGSMLAGRAVATTDRTAFRTATQVYQSKDMNRRGNHASRQSEEQLAS